MNCDPYSNYFQQYGHCPPTHHLARHLDPSTPWWHYAIMVIAGLILLGIVLSAFRSVQQYERGIVIRFGRVVGEREPGLRLVVPLIDRLYHADMRVFTLPLKSQQVITKDSVSLGIRVVVYFQVIDATANYAAIDDSEEAIKQLGQAIMRRVAGQRDLSELLEHGDQVTTAIRDELENSSAEWGLRITRLELKDVDLPETMQRAMAAQAEASRHAAAKVAEASGEEQSAEALARAAALLSPTALRLRELQAMVTIAADNATVVVVPSAGGGELAGITTAGAIAAQAGGR